MPYAVTPSGNVTVTYPWLSGPIFGASKIVVACGASATTVEEPPNDGTVRGVPLSEVKFTVNETVPALELVKYRAEYQPPPNTNWGKTWGVDAVRRTLSKSLCTPVPINWIVKVLPVSAAVEV